MSTVRYEPPTCGWCGHAWPCPAEQARTWPIVVEAQPRTFAPTVIPADAQKVRTEAGVVWQRIPNSVDLWDRADQPLTSRGWVTTGHLLASGTLTEVIEES